MERTTDLDALIKGFLVMNRYCHELQKILIQNGIKQEELMRLFKQISDSVTQHDVDTFDMRKFARY